MRERAQSTVEYTVLIITVAAAFIAMSVYLQRAANDRLHSIELETNPGIIIEGDPDVPSGSSKPAASSDTGAEGADEVLQGKTTYGGVEPPE